MSESAQQVSLSLVETVSRVAELLNSMESRDMVAEQLGWTMDALDQFEEQNSALFEMANEIIISVTPPINPPSDIESSIPESEELSSDAPSPEQIVKAIQVADRNLKRGLQSIGLSEAEAEEAEALQAFNQKHFADSMDMVSANVLKTTLKLAVQQREIETRLVFVRAQITAYGEFASDERDNWVREEKMLVYQYIELGQLIMQIQDTWYKGSACLAVIKLKMKGAGNVGFGGTTQRSNKPGFRPQSQAQPITVEP